MKVISSNGNSQLATVYIGEMEDGHRIEFVESVQPPRARDDKWVNIISTMVGCPVACKMCDAGGGFVRHLTADEMMFQLDYLAERSFPNGKISSNLWKIQLARMGEPTLNPAVPDFLRELGSQGHENLVVSLSTVGPVNCASFIHELKQIKDRSFAGKFQLQFSIHSADPEVRRRLIPIRCMSLPELAELGRRFRAYGDKKIALNFIAMKNVPLEIGRTAELFDPENFLIKITPLNPTYRARYFELSPGFDPEKPADAQHLVSEFERRGFQTLLSIGELEENLIGSNCGQYLQASEMKA
jgi:23S rRNA (adenine2503-C2)-methyltransferase